MGARGRREAPRTPRTRLVASARLALLLALMLATGLVACTPGPARHAATPAGEPIMRAPREQSPSLPAGSRYASEAERALLAPLARDAERIRGLRFARAVEVMVEDADAIRRYVASELEEDALEEARLTYVALGLLEPALDVRGMLLQLMGEQILGYYDPKRKRLVVRDSVLRELTDLHSASERGASQGGQAARSVLVHELVHALQDQRLGLGDTIDAKRDTDAENALRALIEGDATLAMLGKRNVPGGGLRRLTRDPAAVRELARMMENGNLDGALAEAPAIVRIPLLSAYNEGLLLVADLHGAGGWGAVDRAHRQPPISTEQVLHPARYARREAPSAVPAPQVPGLADRGFRALPADTLGELEIAVYFGQALPMPAARRAAGGWDGDRLQTFVGPGGGLVVLWALWWDTVEDAREAATAARAVRARLSPDGQRMALVARHGARTLLARGLPPEFHEGLRTSLDPAGGPH